jgi:hypothetical protein
LKTSQNKPVAVLITAQPKFVHTAHLKMFACFTVLHFPILLKFLVYGIIGKDLIQSVNKVKGFAEAFLADFL